MIDTILILLIFYMSFSTFSASERRLAARMPEYQTHLMPGQRDVPPPEITIYVRSSGEFVVNGVPYESSTLRDSLTTLGLVAPETRVVIEADPATKYQMVITAADVCAQAKLHRLAFRPVQS